jgi:hypothetical protein
MMSPTDRCRLCERTNRSSGTPRKWEIPLHDALSTIGVPSPILVNRFVIRPLGRQTSPALRAAPSDTVDASPTWGIGSSLRSSLKNEPTESTTHHPPLLRQTNAPHGTSRRRSQMHRTVFLGSWRFQLKETEPMQERPKLPDHPFPVSIDM